MVRSMTGFAATSVVIPVDATTKVNMTFSLKSLNSRFFETTCKLPYSLSNLETKLIKLFKSSLLRGHIYFTIHMQGSQLLKSNVEASFGIIKGYLEALNEVKKRFGIEGTVTIDNVLRIPDAFIVQEQT